MSHVHAHISSPTDIFTGHLDEPTPPTSPATLHYRGASFDVVNPHESLLLGVNDLETPAEIDGLLDEYFDNRHSSRAMPYNYVTGEMSSSQQSLHTTSSGGRQRVLYDDPDSARRTIMRIGDNMSRPAFSPNRNEDYPLTNRSQRGNLPLSSSGPHYTTRPGTPLDFERQIQTPCRLQIHPNLREAAGSAPSTVPRHYNDERELDAAESHLGRRGTIWSGQINEGYSRGNDCKFS